MDDYTYPDRPLINQQPLLKVLNFVIAGALLLSILFLLLLVVGYGTIRLTNLPANASVHLNGHPITGSSIKVHPGVYQIVISSPSTNPYQGTVEVGMLQTTNYRPAFQLRNPNAIVSSVIGAFGSDAPVDLYHPQWFENNNWLVGTLLPGNPPIALHYDTAHGQWAVIYFLARGYPQDSTKLPKDVANYVTKLETTYAPG